MLEDDRDRLLVATELESDIRRIEQILRWSREKAHSLPSASAWPSWARDGDPGISQLLIVRWTRANRDAAEAARRQLREAFPADPRDALDALTGAAGWPGPAMLWARLDRTEPRLVAARRRPDQLVARTAARASAKGSRLDGVKPATLIRPWPTT